MSNDNDTQVGRAQALEADLLEMRKFLNRGEVQQAQGKIDRMLRMLARVTGRDMEVHEADE